VWPANGFAEHHEAGAELGRVGHTAAQGGVGNHDFGGHAGGNRRRLGADLQDAACAHPHFAGHHLEVRHLQSGIDRRVKRERAIDGDGVGNRRSVGDGHGMSERDADHVVEGGDDAARPSRRAGPAAALNRHHSRAREVGGKVRDALGECDRRGDGWRLGCVQAAVGNRSEEKQTKGHYADESNSP
jgi:hypothetical protein